MRRHTIGCYADRGAWQQLTLRLLGHDLIFVSTKPAAAQTLKTKGSFTTEEAATKLIFLAIRNFEKGGRNVREWVAARNQSAKMFTGCLDA